MFLLLALQLSLPLHSNACNKLKIRQASEFIFGIDYPYWFSVAQAYIESNCIWSTSLDGWGSVGYFQITPRFWDKELKQVGFYNWQIKDSMDSYYAQAYILKKLNSYNHTGKLYVTYQCYNRSCNMVVSENKEGDWEKGYERCLEFHNQPICVWKVGNTCKQYRYSCDINYEYSAKIFRKGIKMQEWFTNRWRFF